MIKECIKKAPTVEEAKNLALLELGLSEFDEYKIEVLKMPEKKKLFGLLGGAPAEVKITVEVPDEIKKEKPVSKKETAKKDASAKPAPEKKTVAKVEKRESVAEILAEKKATLKPTHEYDSTAEYLKSIILGLGMEKCEIEVYADDEEISFELDCGDDYGIVIGRRGETLDAIQYLVRMVANKGISGYKRVSVNVGNYREKRADVLVSLAKRTAARAVKSGRNITLEPMNPYERRIIHTAVQEVKGATSFSTGTDLDRRVVIAPENGGRGNYGYRDRNDRGRSRRPKKEPYVPEISENREKKNDCSDASVYGKIEVKKNDEE
jgi:spoIIIJ-associated protein